jgi:hypothetical protein
MGSAAIAVPGASCKRFFRKIGPVSSLAAKIAAAAKEKAYSYGGGAKRKPASGV